MQESNKNMIITNTYAISNFSYKLSYKLNRYLWEAAYKLVSLMMHTHMPYGNKHLSNFKLKK